MHDQEYIPGTMFVWCSDSEYRSMDYTFVVLYLSKSKVNFRITRRDTSYSRVQIFGQGSKGNDIDCTDAAIRDHISVISQKSGYFILCPKRGVIFDGLDQEDDL